MQMYKEWNTQFKGWGKAYSTAFLWGGAKINNVTMTNRDMDFTQLRGFTKDTILAAYHIPLTLMGIAEVGSRARAEADEYIFSKYTIKPALQRMREAYNEQLCPLFDGSLEMDFVDPVPADREVLVNEVDRMVRAGVYTREFALQVLGHDISDMKGGTFLMPLGIMPEQAKSIAPRAKSVMSEEQGEARWRQYVAQTEAEEKPFIRALGKLWGEQKDEVISNLQRYNNADFDQAKAEQRFADVLRGVIQGVYQQHYDNMMDFILPENPHSEPHKHKAQLPQDAIEWIKSRSLYLAKALNDTTREEIRAQLAEGLAQGESIYQMEQRIRQYYLEAEIRRAIITARTEVISASAEGEIAASERQGLKQLQFYTALDERTCPICLPLHGQVYSIDQTRGIITGQTHPQCRCIWLPVV